MAATQIEGEKKYIDALLKLVLKPNSAAGVLPVLASLSSEQQKDFAALADSNHVVIRAFDVINRIAGNQGHQRLQAWAVDVLTRERARIHNALIYLHEICNVLEEAGCPVVVMKSLDHWPDLGNDLDLFSTGERSEIVRVLTREFNARIEARSWGDRIANKSNFSIPGLRESIEMHVGRLGQMGEHIGLAYRFVDRRLIVKFAGHPFYVPAPEERIVAATLQRMYRHFYFRICDIANMSSLVDSGSVDFGELFKAADQAGIWPGVASLLKIVSDYVQQYRGVPLALPGNIIADAALGGDKTYARQKFLRVPILPYGARLYTRQLTRTAFQGNMHAAFRLTLLPPLASAAAVAAKLTGSDKGVW